MGAKVENHPTLTANISEPEVDMVSLNIVPSRGKCA